MDNLTQIVADINSILWGPWCLIPVLVGAGIFFTFQLRFIQIRNFARAFKHVFGGLSFNGEKAGNHGMTSFQSLATAIAAQVGTGNLAGVATAMAMGGPGAVFWMWLAAFFGMATIFSEAILGQLYRTKDQDGKITGGPAYYIKHGLGSKQMAAIFSILTIIALGFIGNMVQANSISAAFTSAFSIPSELTGLLLILLAGFIFIGGIRRIAAFTEKLVPLMASIYVLGAVYIMLINFDMIIPTFKNIFVGAFDPSAATGGIIGATIKEAIRYGVARGLFSNEAGMGSTPHAHAIARVKHPVEQGLAAIIGLFIDTFVVLTATALVIMVTNSLDGKTTGNIFGSCYDGFTYKFHVDSKCLYQRHGRSRFRLCGYLSVFCCLFHHRRLVLLCSAERQVSFRFKSSQHVFSYSTLLSNDGLHAESRISMGTCRSVQWPYGNS